MACAVAACSFDRSGAVADGGVAVDAAVDAALPDGAPPVCVEKCSDDTLIECAGGVEQSTPCPLGCSQVGGPHCGELVPSNGLDPELLDGATEGLLVGDGQTATIEADTGRISIDGIETRAAGEGLVDGIRFVGGPPHNVFAIDHLEVGVGATLLVRAPSSPGGVASPLLLLVRRDAEINGLIDLTAGCTDGSHWCAGVGGGSGGTTDYLPLGCAPGKEGQVGTLLEDTGGGGGGLGQNGAPGGDSNDLTGGAGGDAAACVGASLVPIEGGSGGDLGGGGGRGGGGGGAMQLTALGSLRVRPAGAGSVGIWAGGGGGEGGGFGAGGGGGGSGGAILLEAPVVEVGAGAILAANGGGGGEGDGSGNGEKGLLAAAAAGGGGGTVVRHGGKGGFVGGAPEQGDGPGDGTGGGGGGAGRIRINALQRTVDGTFSPTASVGPLTVE